jgi:hypothetical protein
MTSTKHLFSRAILSLTHPASLPKLHSLELDGHLGSVAFLNEPSAFEA